MVSFTKTYDFLLVNSILLTYTTLENEIIRVYRQRRGSPQFKDC